MPKHSKHTVIKSNLLIALAIVVVVLVGAGVYHVRHTSAFVDATTHQPERYTELYFTAPTKLPANIEVGQQLPVDFTVHNVEARSMSYTYDLSLITASGKPLSQSAYSFTLASNDSKVITNDVKIPDVLGRTEVQIFFPALNQSIHFWMQIR
jgi:uncharacterized membrane protein